MNSTTSFCVSPLHAADHVCPFFVFTPEQPPVVPSPRHPTVLYFLLPPWTWTVLGNWPQQSPASEFCLVCLSWLGHHPLHPHIHHIHVCLYSTPVPRDSQVHFSQIHMFMAFPPIAQRQLQRNSCSATPNQYALPTDNSAVFKARTMYTCIWLCIHVWWMVSIKNTEYCAGIPTGPST